MAIIGASAPSGSLVRRGLEERGVEGGRVDLYGFDVGAMVLSEYAGEARIIQEFDPERAWAHDVAFVCARGRDARRAMASSVPGGLVVDLADVWPSAPLAVTGGEAVVAHPGPFAVPHPVALGLAELLRPIHADLTLRGASIVVLRPAADFGEEGLDELREQAVRLLRFEQAPTEVFGRQLAFNAIPQRGLPGGGDASEDRVRTQLATLLGSSAGPVALRMISIPVFHGHAIAARVTLAGGGEEELWSCLRGRPGIEADPGADAASILDAPEDRATRVTEIVPDGANGFWIWAVAGEVASGAAAFAIEFAAGEVDL